MNTKRLAMLLAMVLAAAALAGCQSAPQTAAPAAVETAAPQPVALTVAGSWTDCRAIDLAAKAFHEKYPECTVVYEYVQDYYASVAKRMSGDEPVDLFFSDNIQSGSDMLPFALELYGQKDLDLSNTFEGLIQNFAYRGEAGEAPKLYAVPVGAELRGLYVNKTLLKSVGLDVPTDQASLLAACQTLKEHGYIAFHGNPGDFGQTLLYPWIANLVANAPDAEAVRKRLSDREPGVSELFREPFQFMYTLIQNGYYDYKRAQTELGLYTDTTDEAYARDFFNIKKEGDGFVKADDVGVVAFMPSAMAKEGVIAKTREDYHSQIEYAFVLAPVGPEGGFAYLSPARGLAVCKSAPHADWAVRFLDFLFQPETNKLFAEAFNVIPNTKEAFAYLRTLFDVPDSRICHLGQVTFDFGLYETVIPSVIDLSKGNNPKYMRDDGAGNLSLYPLEYYLERAEAELLAK